jgi:hypothetical protein
VKAFSQKHFSTIRLRHASLSTYGRQLAPKTEDKKGSNDSSAKSDSKNSKGKEDEQNAEKQDRLGGLKKVAKELWVIET